jgi:hypothetical protein
MYLEHCAHWSIAPYSTVNSMVIHWQGSTCMLCAPCALKVYLYNMIIHLVLAMSTGMETMVVTNPLIMLAAKWHLMSSIK